MTGEVERSPRARSSTLEAGEGGFKDSLIYIVVLDLHGEPVSGKKKMDWHSLDNYLCRLSWELTVGVSSSVLV